ncbi:MAG: efflux RND transporter permease subunit [Desulfobulbaceae bacterium]|nr:efflux RND transporter permease subunit [Desulfobulbaceae bacterium]
MKQILSAFVHNTVFANIAMLIIFLAGGMAVFFMIKETFPEFSLDAISVTVAYPGADPEEVEEGVCLKIEEAIEGLEGIKLYTTTSSENLGFTWIEVKENYDVSDVLDKVRNKVNSISTFPLDAEKPVVTEYVLRDLVSFLYLSGDMSEKQLKEWAEKTKDEIRNLPDISQVSVFGARDYEISIEISEEKLRKYGISFAQVSSAIKKSSLNLAGGTIRTRGEEIRIRTLERKYTDKDLASIIVLAKPSGEIITLDRIARIHDGFTEDPIAANVNGERAFMLMVYKTQEEDALAIAERVKDYLAKEQKQLPQGANIALLYDGTEMLRSRIDLLVKNGLIGLGLVFFLLWLFLDVRLSLWSGMGIPISITGALAVLWAMGETINMISLFGLIMVLGIVVDDAIVVGEAIFVHRKMGKAAVQAAIDGVSEVGMPVFAAVITTIVAFIPLAHIGGIMGKFIAIMPVVVIACLAISLLECLFLLPAHLSHLPVPVEYDAIAAGPGRFRKYFHINKLISRKLELFAQNIYAPFLQKVLHWRYISFCTALAILLITVGLLQGGFLKFEVFPEVDGFVISSNVEFPNGTPPEVTEEAVNKIEAALLRLAERSKTRSGEPLLEDRFTLVGQELKDYGEAGPNFGGVQAILLESAGRGIHTKDLMVAWEKEIGPVAGAKSLTFAGLSHGPPGDPIEVWIQGHDMGKILAASNELLERLRQFDGVTQIRSDFSPGKNEVRLTLKPEARTLGLTVEDLARQVNAGYFGDEALRLQRGRNDIRVKVRYQDDERRRLSSLEQVRIRTANNDEVPLRSVADFTYSPGYSKITRTDGMRRVMVSAGVDTNKANANEILSQLSEDYFPQLQNRYPGLYISVQGEQKKMRESFSSLKIGFPLAVVGIFVIIATMFRSYAQPFIILFTVPFGIIGAVVGHLLLGYELSMMSMFGMVALTGVVVNDAIVLIDKININLSEGMPFFEAIKNGGIRRFRAIFLTTLSTVGGLTPLIMETDLQAKFLIPMALSIAAGVTFATVLTLLLIPSILVILNDFRRLNYRLRHGFWPAREEVEPARHRYNNFIKPDSAPESA